MTILTYAYFLCAHTHTLTVICQANVGWSLDSLPISVLKQNFWELGINGIDFYRPDVLPVTQSTESKHCRELRTQTPTTGHHQMASPCHELPSNY